MARLFFFFFHFIFIRGQRKEKRKGSLSRFLNPSVSLLSFSLLRLYSSPRDLSRAQVPPLGPQHRRGRGLEHASSPAGQRGDPGRERRPRAAAAAEELKVREGRARAAAAAAAAVAGAFRRHRVSFFCVQWESERQRLRSKREGTCFLPRSFVGRAPHKGGQRKKSEE